MPSWTELIVQMLSRKKTVRLSSWFAQAPATASYLSFTLFCDVAIGAAQERDHFEHVCMKKPVANAQDRAVPSAS